MCVETEKFLQSFNSKLEAINSINNYWKLINRNTTYSILYKKE